MSDQRTPNTFPTHECIGSTHECVDLISRNAALALVVKAIHGTDSEKIKDYLFGGLRKELWALPSANLPIKEKCQICPHCNHCDVDDDGVILPSAQPERKKGRWLDYTDEGYVECPFCHSATNCDGNKDELHFCFSCGADMRGERND